ncbi:MAG: iron-sulfur cluster assembly scaffold protein [bacterium]
MLAKIYSDELLAAAGNIPKATRLAQPDASATKTSRVCGSVVTVDIKMDDDRVCKFAIDAKACALGQAASSLMAQTIIGASAQELFQLHQQMIAMLKHNGPPPSAPRFQPMQKLQPIRDYPARHTSTLLVFEAVAQCLRQLGFTPAEAT